MSNGEESEFRAMSHKSSGGLPLPHFPHITKTLHDGLGSWVVETNPVFEAIVQPGSSLYVVVPAVKPNVLRKAFFQNLNIRVEGIAWKGHL